jgi:hypothetical protein
MRFLHLAAAILAAAGLAAPASAAFLGQTIEGTAHFPTLPPSTTTAGPVQRVVGAGVEFVDGDFNPFSGEQFDFTDTTIIISSFTVLHSAGGFNGYRFTDIFGTIPDIVSVSIISDRTNYFLTDPGRITWDANNIFINFQGLDLTGANGAQTILGVTFGMAAVPLPAALPLFASALAGWTVLGRKRKAKAV